MHAVEKAIVNIPASFIPFILVTAINKKNDVNALSPVPKIFHIKLLLKFFSFSNLSHSFIHLLMM